MDGNKRVGTVAALVFLTMNGFEVTVDEERFERLILDVISGKQKKEAVGRFFRRNSQPIEDA